MGSKVETHLLFSDHSLSNTFRYNILGRSRRLNDVFPCCGSQGNGLAEGKRLLFCRHCCSCSLGWRGKEIFFGKWRAPKMIQAGTYLTTRKPVWIYFEKISQRRPTVVKSRQNCGSGAKEMDATTKDV